MFHKCLKFVRYLSYKFICETKAILALQIIHPMKVEFFSELFMVVLNSLNQNKHPAMLQ